MKARLFILTIVLLSAGVGAMAQTYDATSLTDEKKMFFKRRKAGLKDNDGTILVPAVYDYVHPVFYEGLTQAGLKGKWGFIDMTGKEVIPLIYEYAVGFFEGLALVNQNGKWGFVDKAGKEVIPLIYEEVARFFEGLAPVKQNGKWGVIDRTGKEVIPLVYEEIGFFSEGLAQVKLNGKWGFIDVTGKEVIPFIYDVAYHFVNGEAKVVENRIVKLIDPTGRVTFTLPKKFNTMDEDFTDGVAIVSFRGRFHTTPTPGLRIDNSGIQYFNIGTYITDIGNAADAGESINQSLIDRTGREIIPYKTGRIINRHTDGTFELFRRSFNGKKIVSTGKFYDKEGNKIEGREKTKW